MALGTETIQSINTLNIAIRDLCAVLTSEGNATSPLIETGNIDKLNDVIGLYADELISLATPA